MKSTQLLLAIFVLSLALPALAQTAPATAPAADPAKLADIRQLIKATGLADLGPNMLEAFVQTQKPLHPELSPDDWTKFQKSIDTTEFSDLLIPMYDRHFTPAEIKDLLTFWKSPTGQKAAREQLAMSREANRFGATWWQRLTEQFQKQLDALPKPAATTKP